MAKGCEQHEGQRDLDEDRRQNTPNAHQDLATRVALSHMIVTVQDLVG
jgi:hypothetical protein